MKRIFIALITTMSLFSVTSCKEFLTEDVYDFYTPENMYRTADDAMAAIAGVYAPMTQFNLLRSEFFQLVDLDQDHGCAEGWIINNGFADGTWQNANTKFKNAWEQLYIIIERANVAIDRIPEISMNETLRNHIVGEAYFLRAMSYFYLVRLWGRVPLRSAMFQADQFVYDAPRESIKKIYDEMIIDGLTTAEELMQYRSYNQLQVGRADRGAAKALLAKVYLTIAAAAKQGADIYVKVGRQTSAALYRTNEVSNSIIVIPKSQAVAGYEAYNADEYFDLARRKAGELIALEGSGDGYRLHPTFMDCFKDINSDRTENIFNLNSSSMNANTLFDYQQFMSYKGDQVLASGFGRGYMLVGNSFYNSYKEEWYGAQYVMNNGVKELVQEAVRSQEAADAGFGSGYLDIPSPNRHLRDERIELGFKHAYTRLSSNADGTEYPSNWFYPQTERTYYTVPECLMAPPYDSGNYQKSDSDTGCTTKYDVFTAVENNRYTDATVSILRYADVILMYAEALNEVYGPTYVDFTGKTAIDYVNQVRVRANAIPIIPTGGCYGLDETDSSYPALNTQVGFRSFVLEERGRELYYEMNRIFDLKRWGMYLDVMNALDAVRAMSKRRQEKHLLFPIPIEELRANSALSVDDNNGW